jgi:RNA polymerase sigma-70 factor (ECF subfamily)
MSADEPSVGPITELLIDWRRGNEGAVNRLFPLVYDELRGLARRQLRGRRPGETLDTTALVHEAYVKLVDQTRAQVHDRRHFFALASKAMRHILVDHARARGAQKRGGGRPLTTLGENVAAGVSSAADLVAIDTALAKLEALDPRLGKLVEVRFFGGLSVEETADTLGVSPRTVKRDWQKARAFLYLHLSTA